MKRMIYQVAVGDQSKLYTHCIELDEYLIGIDVMNIYKIKYFSSFFIMKKNIL